MYREVLKHVAESFKQQPKEILGTVSTSMLETLTDMHLDETYVVNNEEWLTKSFGHYASAYGFDNFYDLYSYAMSVDEMEQVSKGGQKDLDKLKKVTRTVTRNGKPTQMTFYVDPNASDSGDLKEDTKQPEDNAPQPVTASELSGSVVGDFDEKVKVQDLKLITKLASKLGKELDTECDAYVTLLDDTEEARAIVGFKKQGDYLMLAYQTADELTSGLEVRAYYELIRLALNRHLGASIRGSSSKVIQALAESDNFNLEGKELRIDYDTLLETYGEI